MFVDVDYLAFNLWEIIAQKIVKEELCVVSRWQEIIAGDSVYGEEMDGRISRKFLEKLKNARLAARRAAVASKENMVRCKIGGATDKDNLMLQLLAAAISGFNVNDIRKTF